MLRISEVWRIRQIKFQKRSKKCKNFIPFFEILLGSEQLQIKYLDVRGISHSVGWCFFSTLNLFFRVLYDIMDS